MRLFVATLMLGLQCFAADFVLAGRSIPTGTRLHLSLPVATGEDPATEIPISVLHGVKP